MPTPNAVISAAASGEMQLVGLTVEQYDALIETGQLAENPLTELIDGFIVVKDRSHVGEDPMTVGDRHRVAVLALGQLTGQFKSAGCLLQVQQPIVLSPDSEPEPDIAVIRGDLDSARRGKARAGDVLFALEVADASLRRDLGEKLRMYARAGIKCYIVVDLQHDRVLVHRQPVRVKGSYRKVTELGRGDVLELPTATTKPVTIPVSDIL